MNAADILERFIRDAAKQGPFILGLCGSQGSGKSTLAHELTRRFSAEGRKAATLSLDDLYLSGNARSALARDVHPLFATRGVPGTHDVALGLRVLDSIRQKGSLLLPRFDKARDEPVPPADWEACEGPLDLLIFEGWCVGAAPQPDAALVEPVNDLEGLEDDKGLWRRRVNDALGGPYRALFGRIDKLVLLAAPSFDVVGDWRKQQERELAAITAQGGSAQLMSEQEIDRFILHYERLTRHILDEMPRRADLVLHLDRDRHILSVTRQSIDGIIN